MGSCWFICCALRSSALFDDVIVTSEDDVLLSVATQCGVRTVRTDGAYRNGSHRVSAVKKLELERDMIVNIRRYALCGACGAVRDAESLRASSVGCWTISRPCNSEQERHDPNRVKVVVDQASSSLLALIASFNGSAEETRIHVGVYGFQAGQLTDMYEPSTPTGSSEDLGLTGCPAVMAWGAPRSVVCTSTGPARRRVVNPVLVCQG